MKAKPPSRVGHWRWALPLLLAVPLAAAGPVLEKLDPPGGQRGAAVRLLLSGYGLSDDVKIHSEIPGALTPLTPGKEGGARERPYLLEIAGDAAVGAYPIRVETEAGLSNLLLFSVGAFPEIAEEETELGNALRTNDSAESAQPVTAPATVNATLGEADRDFYRVRGRAGERLVAEVEARRIGSAIDPVLNLRDAAGRIIARNDDAPGILADSRLDVRFPADGEYFIEVHDARFSSQSHDSYRLKLGGYPYAAALFPLGWRAGETVEVEMFGGSLEAPVKVRPELTGSAAEAGWAMLSLPDGAVSLPLPFVVSGDPEILEPAGEGPHPLEAGAVVNGRVSRPGERDRYRLAVQPGEHWLIETQAAGLGTSRLYCRLTLFDQDGNKLASAGDKEPDEPLSNLVAASSEEGDPHLGFEVPEGVSELILQVDDLLGRGGHDFSYRLVARPQPPDFTLTLAEPYLNIPQAGTATISVTMNRRGYDGAVKLSLEGVPSDIEVEGGHIPAEEGGMTTRRDSRRGMLALTPKPGAEPRALPLRVIGEARLPGGTLVRREAHPPGMVTAVRGRGQKPVTAPWLGAGLPARVAAPEPAALEVLSSRRVKLIQGMEHEIRWAFVSREPGVAQTDTVSAVNIPAVGNIRVIGGGKIKKGERSGVLTLITTMGTPAMKFDVLLAVDVRAGGREQTIYSAPILYEVVQGYRIDAPEEPVRLTSGSAGEIAGRFEREPEFASPVHIKASNLPVGVECEETQITGRAERFRILCRVSPQTEPGEYEIELSGSSTLAGRDKEAVPYNHEPVRTRVVVEPGQRVAEGR